MTILFAGGEEGELTKIGACSVSTTATYRRSAYARCTLRVATNTASDGWLATFAAAAAFWVSGRVYMYKPGSGFGYSCRMLTFRDNATARLALVGSSSSSVCDLEPDPANYWRLVKIDAAGTVTVLQTSTVQLTASVLTKVDVYVNYAVSGQVQVFLDGSKIIDYSGDVTTNSATTLSGAVFGPSIADPTYSNHWSEIIVSTTDTRTLTLVTLAAAGAGNTNTWSSGTHAEVSETALDDNTTATSSTAGQVFETTVANAASIPSTASVLAVVVNARAQKGNTGGPANANLMVRTGSADYLSAATALPTGALSKITGTWETNPATGSAWTPVDLTAAGFNIGIKSVT